MARIRILSSSHHGSVPISLNGDTFIMNVPADGGETTVPARFLPLLGDSSMVFEIVAAGDGDDEAGAGAGGDSGAAPAEAVAGPEPTPGVESPTFDASSNTAMPASPPNPSPSKPAPGEAKPKAPRKRAPKKAKAPAAPKAS